MNALADRAAFYRERLARLCSAIVEAELLSEGDWQSVIDLAHEFEADLDHEPGAPTGLSAE
jgi:hypothetical protein